MNEQLPNEQSAVFSEHQRIMEGANGVMTQKLGAEVLAHIDSHLTHPEYIAGQAADPANTNASVTSIKHDPNHAKTEVSAKNPDGSLASYSTGGRHFRVNYGDGNGLSASANYSANEQGISPSLVKQEVTVTRTRANGVRSVKRFREGDNATSGLAAAIDKRAGNVLKAVDPTVNAELYAYDTKGGSRKGMLPDATPVAQLDLAAERAFVAQQRSKQ